MFELNEKDYAKIAKIAKQGDQQADLGNWDAKIEKYLQAWELVPEPKHEWDGCTWIIGGIAEAYFKKGNIPRAKDYFEEGLKCYRGDRHSFILFRLGQIHLDNGDFERAREYLRKAWDLSEGRQFVGQPRRVYRDFLLNKKR